MTASPALVEALIRADELALTALGEEPTYDPDASLLWRKRRTHLQVELAMFRNYARSLEMAKDKPNYDPRCLELAEYFLIDEPNLRGFSHDLARHIQQSIEDWFELVKQDRVEGGLHD